MSPPAPRRQSGAPSAPGTAPAAGAPPCPPGPNAVTTPSDPSPWWVDSLPPAPPPIITAPPEPAPGPAPARGPRGRVLAPALASAVVLCGGLAVLGFALRPDGPADAGVDRQATEPGGPRGSSRRGAGTPRGRADLRATT